MDNHLTIEKHEGIEDFKREIKRQFVAKNLCPADQILSVQIIKEDDGFITLDQTGYITEILDNFKMSDGKPAATPLDPSIKYYYVSDQKWEKVKKESKKDPIQAGHGKPSLSGL